MPEAPKEKKSIASAVEYLGNVFIKKTEGFGNFVMLFGQTMVASCRPPYRFKQLLISMEFVGWGSLFIIMLTGTQSQKTLQSEMADTGTCLEEAQSRLEEAETRIRGMEERSAGLEQELAQKEAELDHYRNVEETGRVYEDAAVLITMENTVKDGVHVLEIYQGREGVFYDSISMGAGKKVYIHDRLTTIIRKITEEADGQPVFIVFHCKKDSIYHREEFEPVSEALETLRKQKKEVFYQILEE